MSGQILGILKGVIDIYMPDFKFWNPETSKTYCHARDYPQIARRAIQEMHHQVGDLKKDRNGIAFSGLMVRHLVMPGCLDETHGISYKSSLSSTEHINISDPEDWAVD